MYVNQTPAAAEAHSSQTYAFRNGYHDGFHDCSRDLDIGNIDPGANVLANGTELKEIDPGINRTGEPDIGIDPGISLLKLGIDIENIDPGSEMKIGLLSCLQSVIIPQQLSYHYVPTKCGHDGYMDGSTSEGTVTAFNSTKNE